MLEATCQPMVDIYKCLQNSIDFVYQEKCLHKKKMGVTRMYTCPDRII